MKERIEGTTHQFRIVLNDALNIFFKDAVRVALSNPSQAYFFHKMVRRQHKAASNLLDGASDEYIIYSLWEIAEECISAVCNKPTAERECVAVGGLMVAKDKVEKLTAWRKQQGVELLVAQ